MRITYRQMFDEPRPEISGLFQIYSSQSVIASLAMITDKLLVDGTSARTQLELLTEISTDYEPKQREETLKHAFSLVMQGYIIFSLPVIVELINREFSNFRKFDQEPELPEFEGLNMLKAIVAVSDEMSENDSLLFKDAIEAAKLGGKNLIKLIWPHIIKQYEFSNEPDAIFECYKGMAFIAYLERHPKFGGIAKSYFESLGCSCGQDYLHRIISIVIEYIKRDQSGKDEDYFFNIKLSSYEPVLEALVIDPQELRNNPAKQIDYRGLKEKPIFKIDENHYIVPYWHYLLNAFFTGLCFSFYRNSGIAELFDDTKNGTISSGNGRGLAKFKSIVGKEFSEEILFKNTMSICFDRRYDSLAFFEDKEQFNPDCYYRRGNNIFIIEFKDYLLNSDVIQSNSYEKIKEEIDKKFVSYTVDTNGKKKVKEKGISQLARNIEKLLTSEDLFYKIDAKAKSGMLNLKKMNIYPIIIHTNIYFDIPGINDYLNEIISDRLNPLSNSVKLLKPFTMINFQYFFDRLILFADARLKLDEEIDHYHRKINKLKFKAQKTFSENDWFNSLNPFSFYNSDHFKESFEYRRDDLLDEVNKCWMIND